jgi:hypothetical protein
MMRGWVANGLQGQPVDLRALRRHQPPQVDREHWARRRTRRAGRRHHRQRAMTRCRVDVCDACMARPVTTGRTGLPGRPGRCCGRRSGAAGSPFFLEIAVDLVGGDCDAVFWKAWTLPPTPRPRSATRTATTRSRSPSTTAARSTSSWTRRSTSSAASRTARTTSTTIVTTDPRAWRTSPPPPAPRGWRVRRRGAGSSDRRRWTHRGLYVRPEGHQTHRAAGRWVLGAGATREHTSFRPCDGLLVSVDH